MGTEDLGTARRVFFCDSAKIHEFRDSYQHSVDIYELSGVRRKEVIFYLSNHGCNKMKVKCSYREPIRFKEEFK